MVNFEFQDSFFPIAQHSLPNGWFKPSWPLTLNMQIHLLDRFEVISNIIIFGMFNNINF